MKRKKILIALDEDIYTKLKKIKIYKGIPITSMVNNALRYTLKKTNNRLVFDLREVLK